MLSRPKIDQMHIFLSEFFLQLGTVRDIQHRPIWLWYFTYFVFRYVQKSRHLCHFYSYT